MTVYAITHLESTLHLQLRKQTWIMLVYNITDYTQLLHLIQEFKILIDKLK